MDAIEAGNLQIAGLAEHALKTALVYDHPELVRVADELGADVDIENEQAIVKRFAEKVQRDGCPPSYGTFEACYCEALQAGEVKLPPPIEPRDDDSIALELHAKADQAQTPAERENFTKQLRMHLESQQPPRPTNKAEFLTGEGSYRWKQSHSDTGMDEQALAALLGSVGGTP